MPDHFYTTDDKGESAPWVDYTLEGTSGFVFKSQQPGTVPIYRFYNPSNGDHFYCQDPNGENCASTGYVKEYEFAWYMYNEQKPGTTPFYRWSTTGDHFYTTRPDGEGLAQQGYGAEGILGYIYTGQQPGTTALYRWIKWVNYELKFDAMGRPWLSVRCFNLKTREMRWSDLYLDYCIALQTNDLIAEETPEDLENPSGDRVHYTKLSQYLRGRDCELKLEHGYVLHYRMEEDGVTGKKTRDSYFDVRAHVRRARDGVAEFIHAAPPRSGWFEAACQAAQGILDDIGKGDMGPHGDIHDAFGRLVQNFRDWLDANKPQRVDMKQWMKGTYPDRGRLIRRGD